MNPTIRHGLLVFVEVLLFFSVVCVLPFAWILRDGLGPGSVSTTGLASVTKTFMTFYIGPFIVLLVALDILLRRLAPSADASAPRSAWILWAAGLVIVSVLSFVLVWIMMG